MIKIKLFLLYILLTFSISQVIANDDLGEVLSLETSDAYAYAHQLPKDRQLKLAYRLLEEQSGMIVYLGTQILIKHGKEKDTFSPLVKLIAEGKDKTDLNGRMGYDWLHIDGNNLWSSMTIGIMEHMNNNYYSYDSGQQKRFLYYFKGMMKYEGDYNKDSVNKSIDAFRIQTNSSEK